MTKVVMLGISGLDADLLRVYGPSLPDMRRLLLHSPFLEMRSCFPPEPLPAWASVYTGLHPTSHGLLSGGDTYVRIPFHGTNILRLVRTMTQHRHKARPDWRHSGARPAGRENVSASSILCWCCLAERSMA